MMLIQRCLPIILVAVIVVACAPAPDLRDPSFLSDDSIISGEPCSAPCWQDLIPGETVWGVAQDTIATSENYVEVDNNRDRRTGEAWIEFAYQDGLKCCRIYTNDGETLTSILLLFAPQNLVSEVVTTHGEPTYITAQAETSDQAYVALVYPDIAMVVYAFAENISTSDITGDSEIVGVVYMSADEMAELIQTQNLYNWGGYGNLGELIDGNFDVTPIPDAETE